MKFAAMPVPAVRVAVAAILVLGLAGCSSLREAAGFNKMAPDEFAVLTKAPLAIPPSFGLMPPKPGAAPTNQADPGSSAQAALYGTDPAAVAANMQGNASMGEKLLLATAGAADADPAIRQQLAADTNDMLAADDAFANKLMFWQPKKADELDKAVDAEAEAARLKGAKSGQPAAQPQEDKGWFDGLFDWL